MMMTYIQNHSSNHGRKIRITGYIVSVIIIVIFSVRFIFPNLFPSIFIAIARPFWRVEYSINSGQLRSVENLLNENQELQRKLDIQNIEQKSIQLYIDENQQLKSLMGRASTTQGILAAVIMRPPVSPYDEIFLDIGSDQGLQKDNIVYASRNVPIGKISEVYSHTSKVILFSSSGQSYSVLIGKNNTPATAIGLGGGQYSAELPRTSVVVRGDYVSIASVKASLYSTVDEIVADSSSPFETVLFSSPINIYELKWAYVEK